MDSLVAVAVIVRPAATLLDGEKVNEPLPDPSTVRPVFWPIKVWPSLGAGGVREELDGVGGPWAAARACPLWSSCPSRSWPSP